MAREVLHPLACPCSQCRHPAEDARLHPDQAAGLHGLLAGILFGAILGALQLIPILVEWLRT